MPRCGRVLSGWELLLDGVKKNLSVMREPSDIYLAIDLGASGGRVMAGELSLDGEIRLQCLHRFEQCELELADGLHWDVAGILDEIKQGLRVAGERYGERVVSLGVDTWGVDYGLLDGQGELLEAPFQYRDKRTDGAIEATFKLMPQEEIYRATGIQFVFFNTLFQLVAAMRSGGAGRARLEDAADLLFMPDLINYFLTGLKLQERTIASTSQLYDPVNGGWSQSLIEGIGLPKHLFKGLREPGNTLGELRRGLAADAKLDAVRVVNVASHDTASAVAGLPSTEAPLAFLSSGTWSLMGLELEQALINQASFESGFSNEVGLGGRIRFLKNLCGLWLLQECRRQWQAEGLVLDYAELTKLAQASEPLRSVICPQDARFNHPGAMLEKIRGFCEETEQAVPASPGAVVRCIYESLALQYALVWRQLGELVAQRPDCLHIVGGGCQDNMLNQMVADALGVVVIAGPVEATSLGNIVAQLLADGKVSSLAEGRSLVARSCEQRRFEPRRGGDWSGAMRRFEKMV